ncbi:MAG: nucleotidyltransferase domain-containing protein, partial [Promethearchaeia archaeon]
MLFICENYISLPRLRNRTPQSLQLSTYRRNYGDDKPINFESDVIYIWCIIFGIIHKTYGYKPVAQKASIPIASRIGLLFLIPPIGDVLCALCTLFSLGFLTGVHRRCLNQIYQAIKSIFTDSKVFLFGSILSNDLIAGSDINILIIADVTKCHLKRAKLIADIEKSANLPLVHPFE